MTARLSIAGYPATAAVLHEPWTGVWTCDVDVAEDVELSGRVEVRLGDIVLSGTIDPSKSGFYRAGTRATAIGGAAGWERPAPRKQFHADQGLRRSAVLSDTARAVGETVAIDASADGAIGTHFIRQDVDEEGRPLPSSTVFARTGSRVWWVARDGTTRVAVVRPPGAAGAVEILDFDVRQGLVELSDIAPIEVGAPLVLDGVTYTVRELRVIVSEKRARTEALVVDVLANRIYDAIAAVAHQVMSARLHGLYRYRVFEMSGQRARLQRANKRAVPGLPDVLPVSMWPGCAGAWAKLRAGAIVLVEFVEGDVSRPVVTHFESKDTNGVDGSPGFVPIELLLAGDKVMLAGPDGAAVHRVGDTGTAGTVDVVPGGTGLLFTNAAGETVAIPITFAGGAVTVGPSVPPGPFTIKTAALTGSPKVTSE